MEFDHKSTLYTNFTWEEPVHCLSEAALIPLCAANRLKEVALVFVFFTSHEHYRSNNSLVGCVRGERLGLENGAEEDISGLGSSVEKKHRNRSGERWGVLAIAFFRIIVLWNSLPRESLAATSVNETKSISEYLVTLNI